MGSRSGWLSAFPAERRGDLVLAFNDAVYFGRDSLARHVASRGGWWAAGKGDP